MNKLVIEAKLENMGEVLDFVDERLSDCPVKLRNQIGIAVDEIFSNIARYAYAPETGYAEIRVDAGDEIIIEFADGGMAYNPLETTDPNVSVETEERKIGGLGIFLVKKLMDSVEYRREGNKNILVIGKTIKPNPK